MKRVLLFTFYCMFIFLIIILADLDKLPLYKLSRIRHYDLYAHIILYGIFYGLLNYCLDGKSVSIMKYKFSIAFLITSSLIVLEEISHLFFISMTFSILDMIMGFFGMYIFRRFKI